MKSKNQTVPVSLELLAQACHAMDKRKAPNTFDEFQRMIKAGLAANSPKAGEQGLDIDALQALALETGPGPWCVQHPNAGTRGWEVAGLDGLEQIAADLTATRAAFIAAANPNAVLELIGRVRELEKELSLASRAPKPDEVEWVVNDLGELGVRVRGICYFCYKGESLVYRHSPYDPRLVRNVGKREFGETVWPRSWTDHGRREDKYDVELQYQPGLSDGPPDNPKYKWLRMNSQELAPQFYPTPIGVFDGCGEAFQVGEIEY